MASPPPPPPPYNDEKTALMGHPASPPPPPPPRRPPPSRGHQPRDKTSESPHSPHPHRPCAPLSNGQPQSELISHLKIFACMTVFFICCFIVLDLTTIFAEKPILKVAGLTVSNLTVTASAGATWEAFVLVERSQFEGETFFHGMECFVYYHWDATKPLAMGSAEPFMLRERGRAMIEVKMTMEQPEEAMVEDMDRERRSVGTVAVGLGLRMRGYHCGRVEAYCDNLRVAFANSTGEGSLVIGDNGDDLPTCSHNVVY